MKLALALLLTGVLLSGCASTHHPVTLSASHPASAQAEEAPFLHSKHLAGADPISSRSKARLAGDAVPAPSRQQMSDGLYVCPMHPEVQSNKPAQCPKCGMALVQK